MSFRSSIHIGGPGFGCRSPQNYGWTDKALDKGYQIIFLDQRGNLIYIFPREMLYETSLQAPE